MMQIVIPMVVFTALIVALASLVLVARRRLAPAMDVSITINEQRSVTATTGDKLLWQLARAGIYLPAACGGRGACGQCRCEVVQGGGGVMPMEKAHLTLKEVRNGIRLACMVTVREPLTIRLPQDVFEAQRWTATVRSNRNLSTFLKELILDLPEPISFQAGDYVLLKAPPGTFAFADFDIDADYIGEWQRLGLLRLAAEIAEPTIRAYSLANPPTHSHAATLVVRIATPPTHAPPGTPPGMVSSYVFSLKPGDRVELSGPFGEFHARESTREMVFIGGGAGVAPMHAMIVDQLETKRNQRPMSFWYGARNLRELCYREEFESLMRAHENFRYEVALSEPESADQWGGSTGFIHKVVFDKYLGEHPRPEEAEYYLCGPPLMSAAVLAMLQDLGVDRQSVFFDDFGS